MLGDCTFWNRNLNINIDDTLRPIVFISFCSIICANLFHLRIYWFLFNWLLYFLFHFLHLCSRFWLHNCLRFRIFLTWFLFLFFIILGLNSILFRTLFFLLQLYLFILILFPSFFKFLPFRRELFVMSILMLSVILVYHAFCDLRWEPHFITRFHFIKEISSPLKKSKYRI